MNTLLRVIRRRIHGDDHGISLVEVMVSITILAITMAATASSVVQSLQVARDSREAVLGANVAQFELERVRSIPFSDWADVAQRGNCDGPPVVETGLTGPNGQVYDIERSACWVSADLGDGCGTGEGSDYIRITQIVTIPGRDDVNPVENSTIITPRLTFFDADSGNMVVFVRDRDGIGTEGINVDVRGVGGSYTEATDENGCAFFTRLTVDTDTRVGDYEVTLDRNGYVDRATFRERAVQDVTVATQQTTAVEFEYDEAVDFQLTPTLPATPLVASVGDRRPQADCTIGTVRGVLRAGGVVGDYLFCADSGGNPYVPRNRPNILPGEEGFWVARLPGRADGQYGLGYSITQDTYTNDRIAISAEGQFNQPRQDTISQFYFPGDNVGTDDPRLLYPFTDGYGVHTGRCASNAPGYQFPSVDLGGDEPLLLPANPGGTSAAGVEVAVVSLYTANNNRTATEGGRHVWAEMRNDTNCAAGEILYLGESSPNGYLRAVLPFGEWMFYHSTDRNNPSSGGTPFSCDAGDPRGNLVNWCLEIGADYEVEEDPGDGACSGATGSWTANIQGIGNRTLTVDCTAPAFNQTGFVYAVRPAP